jgi:hypothetical protein
VALGLAAGVPLAWLTSRLVALLLFGVSPGAPHVFIISAGVLSASVALAAAAPLRTAIRVPPSQSLRES